MLLLKVFFFFFYCLFCSFRSSHRKYSVKWDVLKNSQNSQQNTCARVSFSRVTCVRGVLAQVFCCEFCEISKNTFSQNTSGQLLLCLFCSFINPIMRYLVTLYYYPFMKDLKASSKKATKFFFPKAPLSAHLKKMKK